MRNPGVIRFSEKDFAKFAPKIKGLSGGGGGSSSGRSHSSSSPKKKRGGRKFKKAGLFSGSGFLGLGRSKQRIRARNGEPMKEPTAKQKRARSKNKNNPSRKQLAARRKFAAMSKRRAREARAARRGVVKKAVNRTPGASQNRRGNKRANVSRSGRTSTSSDVRSPTRTATSTRALTTGNVTVTGGAGRGATTRVTLQRPSQANKKRKNRPTPKQLAWRKKFALLSKRRAKANKANKSGKKRTGNKSAVTRRRNSAVNEVFKTFVGRDSANINDVDFPDGSPTNLAQLGILVKLKSETETFEFDESERVYLAADGRGNLYVGGKQQPVEPNTSFGKLLSISYVCKKAHIEPGKTIEYVHKFGDEGGKCPTLRSDKEGRFTIKGGTYTVTSAGIAD